MLPNRVEKKKGLQMKVTIEIDLPEGQEVPTSEDVLRLTSPDWMAIWWHSEDVLDQSKGHDDDDEPTISLDEAREVLRRAKKWHDSTFGICWDTLECYIDDIVTERKKK
jgi:hypothetical protein